MDEETMTREFHAVKQGLAALSEWLTDFRSETARCFEAMERRFEKIDERFEKIDERFERIDQRFRTVDARFIAMEGKFATKEEFKSEFERLHARFDDFMALMTGTRSESKLAGDAAFRNQTRLDDLERRLARLEARRA